MLELLGIGVAAISMGVSIATAWLTLGGRGRVRAAQPPTVYFGPDGAGGGNTKIFVRLLLYSTAARGRIVEGMYARLHRGDSTQSFSVWVCGEGRGELSRGAGITVRPDGVARDHHFLLPRDGTTYAFLAGVYKLDLFAVIVGDARPTKLTTIEISVSEAQAATLHDNKTAGLYFDWSPETGRYVSHLNNARLPDPPPFLLFADGLKAAAPPLLPAGPIAASSQAEVSSVSGDETQ